MQRYELSLQIAITDYIRLAYPKAIFRSDYASGLRLTISQAVLHKRLQAGRAYPDLQVIEPRGNYHGLFVELKKDGTILFKKDGTLRADKHLQEQAEMLEALRQRGYCAEFGVGFDETKKLIDEYMKLPKSE